MIEDVLIQSIGSLGFPIFVATYFMFKTEKILKGNTEALNSIKEVILNCKMNKK